MLSKNERTRGIRCNKKEEKKREEERKRRDGDSIEQNDY